MTGRCLPSAAAFGLARGVPLVLWAFVLPGRPGCAPTRETETEARRRVHLARGVGVGCGGGRLADGCGARVLGQWRLHSQQAPRRLTGHGAVFVTPRVAADRFLCGDVLCHVRFGSKADMCSAARDVRFTPIADICGAASDVRFGPIADMLAWKRSTGSFPE